MLQRYLEYLGYHVDRVINFTDVKDKAIAEPREQGLSLKELTARATALHASFTLDEMINLDLSYAPPYAPVWDPVIIAARQALKQL
jgi:cysteinyl-tRNA synthetase